MLPSNTRKAYLCFLMGLGKGAWEHLLRYHLRCRQWRFQSAKREDLLLSEVKEGYDYFAATKLLIEKCSV